MSTVNLTIYEALAKKKILESQMEKVKSFRLVDIKKKYANENKDGIDILEIQKKIQQGFDKSISVVKNYSAIKAAINEANAKTTVVINGKTYTIANAIARQRGLDKEERLYRTMLEDYNETERSVKNMNERNLSPDAISKYIQNTSGGTKMNDELAKNLTDEYKKRFELEMYDPLNTKEKAEEALEDIKKFREEIHFALTQANINTTIEVEFDD